MWERQNFKGPLVQFQIDKTLIAKIKYQGARILENQDLSTHMIFVHSTNFVYPTGFHLNKIEAPRRACERKHRHFFNKKRKLVSPS
ncbi:hypothetical protein HZS_2225 [Henneguya salminicola]|nr:hypothetical protein HZS_2225 [Henneguya salminicola]